MLRNKSQILRNEPEALTSDHYRVYTEQVNKIALSSNDDKRIQIIDKVTTFPCGTNAFKVCESEMLLKSTLNEYDDDIDNTETEDIDNTETEDIDISKNAYIDISKNAYIDISKTEDIDNTKTEDKDNTNTEDDD